MYFLYSLLFTVGIVFMAPYYLWRKRSQGGAGIQWRERFGFLPNPLRSADEGAIWVHAVSVGETLAAGGLVRALQEAYPARPIFLSHVTPTGRDVGEKRLPSVAGRFYLPLDWGCCVRRVLRQIRPSLLVIVETELWPNLLREARRFGTRVVVVNARLSARSFRGYRMARPFMRRVLENVDYVCAQTAESAERFRTLGARAERVRLAGNLKFDADAPRVPAAERLNQAVGAAQRSPVIVMASTMPGEELALLESWSKIRQHFAQALLILAPRHPVRFEEVAKLLANRGTSFIRRSGLKLDEPGLSDRLQSPEVLLLDTMGELAGIFALADLVFVGGSLLPFGGHNPIEPAYWAKAVVFGPHMENFRDIAALFIQSKAALQVRDAQEFGRQAVELLNDPASYREIGKRAKQVLENSAGATERVLEVLTMLLEQEHAIRSEA